MFVVKVYGGLGNQIFQFIFGKYLEVKYNVEVKFDLYYFSYFNYRDPAILKLVNNINILDDKSVYFKYNPTKSYRINRIWNSIFNKKSYLTEKNNLKNLPSFLSNRGLIYFDGYWQTMDYFSDFPCEVIHSFFNFPPPKIDLNKIKIHVRRGDYLSLPNRDIFHVQEAQYYIDALEYLFFVHELDWQKVNLCFYTDDVDWVKCNFNFKYTLVTGTEIDDFISLCSAKFLITSNSTFSLAAAHLNYEKNIVVAPKLWYKDVNYNQQFISKLYLSKWKSL